MKSYKPKLAYLEMHQMASTKMFEYAKKLRENMTKAEIALWEELRAKKLDDLKFRRQHPIGIYILDFYCHAKRLSIELDGGYHKNEEQRKFDKERTFHLKEVLIDEIRFRNEEVLTNIPKVLNEIRQKLKELETKEKERTKS
ncbi:MAG: very-short-patch-repair endonuclease [Paraglaciecola sp.]|jgi:very-short-patch-repair endonuclease